MLNPFNPHKIFFAHVPMFASVVLYVFIVKIFKLTRVVLYVIFCKQADVDTCRTAQKLIVHVSKLTLVVLYIFQYTLVQVDTYLSGQIFIVHIPTFERSSTVQNVFSYTWSWSSVWYCSNFHFSRGHYHTCRTVRIIIHVFTLTRLALFKVLLYTCTCTGWHVSQGTFPIVYVFMSTLLVMYSFRLSTCPRWHVCYCIYFYCTGVRDDPNRAVHIFVVHLYMFTAIAL